VTEKPRNLRATSPWPAKCSERNSGSAVQRHEHLLTVDQLANLWQVSPRTIRRKIEKKQIPIIRIGRSVRIHPMVARLDPNSSV
jgi:excisionase family DNA binding protein